MNGSPVYGERVVVVEVYSGNVNLRTGRIASTESSHVVADNRDRTVVWGDRQFNPAMGSPEEAHEKAFRVNDIHLLKQQEAQMLLDLGLLHNWFGSIYQDPLLTKIHRALKRLKLT